MTATSVSHSRPTSGKPPLVLGVSAAIPSFIAAVMMMVNATSSAPSAVIRQYIPLFLGMAIGMSICMAVWQFQYAQSAKGESQGQPLDGSATGPSPTAAQPYNGSQQGCHALAIMLMIVGGLCSVAILVISIAELRGTAVPPGLLQARFLFMAGFIVCTFTSLAISFGARHMANDAGASQRADVAFDEQLRKLAALNKDGVISDAEHADARERILAKLGA